MPDDTKPSLTVYEAAAHEALVANLRDTHALEKQQIQVLEAHLGRFEDYPDLHAAVTDHILVTRDQTRRLESALDACGASSSMVKDALMSAMGLGQSSVQSFGDQAALKAVVADHMQEHLEIATYRVLLVLAEEAGKPDLRARLEESLHEEEAMAAWFDENLEAITRRFVELKVADERQAAIEKQQEKRAEKAEQEASPTSDSEMSGTLWQQLENAKEAGAHPKFTADKSRDKGDASQTTARPDTNRPATAEVPAGDDDASRPGARADRT